MVMYLGDLWACFCHSWDQDYKKVAMFSNAGITCSLEEPMAQSC